MKKLVVVFFSVLFSAQAVLQAQAEDFGGMATQSAYAISIYNQSIDYTGAYRDRESAMVYLDARYYKPDIGRFASRDSYSLINRYAYADGNPINNVDPSGHDAKAVGETMLNWVVPGYDIYQGVENHNTNQIIAASFITAAWLGVSGYGGYRAYRYLKPTEEESTDGLVQKGFKRFSKNSKTIEEANQKVSDKLAEINEKCPVMQTMDDLVMHYNHNTIGFRTINIDTNLGPIIRGNGQFVRISQPLYKNFTENEGENFESFKKEFRTARLHAVQRSLNTKSIDGAVTSRYREIYGERLPLDIQGLGELPQEE